MSRFIAPAILLAAAAIMSACRIDQMTCAGVGLAGILVDVRDPAGNLASPAATVVATDGAFADTVGPVVPGYLDAIQGVDGSIGLAENRGGDYTVTASKPYWSTATQHVQVPGGQCGYVETQHVRLTITRAPDAPALRSVAVAPRFVRFGFCGSAANVRAFVDADSAVSHDVLWRTDDPAVATVSPAGLISVHSHGTTRIRARAAADTMVSGSMMVQVDPIC